MFINRLQEEKSLLQQLQKHHQTELYARDNPSGILLCHRHRSGFRWQRRYLQDGHPLTADLQKSETRLAGKLAVNLYRLICIQFLQKQLFLTDNLIRSLQSDVHEKTQAEPPVHILLSGLRAFPHKPADFFHPQSPYRSFLLAHLQNKYAAVLDWYLGDYKQNSEYPERLQFPVKLGYNVRSKSEVAAADLLYQEGILFHYEEMLLLSEKAVYPDFYIPVTALEKYAWEHFGAMDSDAYFHRTRGKILSYLDHQWFPGINMITTYETRQHPLTEEQIHHQIHWLKNRYRLAFPDLPPDESFNLYDLAAYEQFTRIGT